MPSGTYNDDMPYCKICGRKLRPLYKNKDWINRKYHVSCFKDIVSDISNYNKLAYSKYKHKRIIADLPEDEARETKSFTINFE